MKTIERIDKLLDERGIPKRGRKKLLADLCGISYESVRKWYSGQTASIDIEHLTAIARRYRKPVQWLATGEGDPEASAQIEVPLLLLNQITPYLAGVPVDTENAGRQSAFIREAVESSSKTFAIVWTTEGMSPRIRKDDTVYIDPEQKKYTEGGVFLFDIGGKKSIYELGTVQETPAGMMLHFDNESPGWDPIPVDEDKCIGKVVAFIPSWI